MDQYNKELENKLLNALKEKEKSDKRLLTLEWVIGGLSMIILFVPIFIAAYAPLPEWQRVLTLFSGFIPALVGFSFTMRVEQVAGYYSCQHCGHRYVPELKTMYFAPHMGRTRWMKCPECGQKSWQKKVLTKETEND